MNLNNSRDFWVAPPCCCVCRSVAHGNPITILHREHLKSDRNETSSRNIFFDFIHCSFSMSHELWISDLISSFVSRREIDWARTVWFDFEILTGSYIEKSRKCNLTHREWGNLHHRYCSRVTYWQILFHITMELCWTFLFRFTKLFSLIYPDSWLAR